MQENMNLKSEEERSELTAEKKKRKLYERQKEMLALFLAQGAISRTQYDKSLSDLTKKMGYGSENDVC